MNRLGVRLTLSHLAAALVGTLCTYLVVRQLAPALFDEGIRQGPGPGGGQGAGAGLALRQQVADAVDRALLVGALAGAAAAAVAGFVAAYLLGRPIRALREAAHAIARGRYGTEVSAPSTRELAQLAGDLGSLGRSLADTEATRMRLLGEVAHEMRTPLTVIDGYLEGMIDGILPTTATELGLLSDETRRLRRLAGDLSALSRADEGQLALRLAEVDLAVLTRAAAERLRPQIEDAGLTLAIEPNDVAVPVRADPERIAQVVTNLVGNAVRAGSPGGTIRIVCRRAPGEGVIEIHDDGAGIAGADLERVFERFYRVGGRRSTDGGSGIGLTISRAIARAHGGELSADSPGLGHGAVFTVRLPTR